MNLKYPGKKEKGRIFLKAFEIRSIFILLIFIFLAAYGFSQNNWKNDILRPEPVICQASNETGHSYIAPPEGFLNHLKSGKKTSTIVIQYVNVPDSVKPAIRYAAEIWEYLISSAIPIYLKVSWEVLDKSTLGSCGASSYYHNFEGAPLRNTYYPVALVEKITGKEISGSGNPDMIARFNSTIPWYTGTDGKTPTTRYDLVTIVLHEITHGLGFNGFFRANTTQKTASYGLTDDYPAIYDCFVENTVGNKLTNVAFYANYSNDLYKTITSGSLYSGGPVTVKWGNSRSRLYAPSIYSSGSSIYHLNDLTYSYGNINALMTSSAGKGEAIHSPGPLTSGMLADIGWKYMSINFKPIKDFEAPADSLTFNAFIQSDLGIKSKSVNLIFSRDFFKTHRDTVRFEPVDVEGNYKVRIKTGFTSGKLSYYIVASDTTGRKFTSPFNFPDSVFTLTIGPDYIKPVISHHSPRYLFSYPGTFEIMASVQDNTGVDSVKVIFFKNGKESVRKNLENKDNNIYRGIFNLRDLNLENVDSVRYSILAMDKAIAKNTSQLPEKGTFSIKLERIQSPVKEYSNNFETQLEDFILSDFIINTEFGFANNALNSPHPYPSPDKDNDSLEFTTILRYPVILNAKGGMSYDEVVLVEPGEPGAVYGSSDFYDYVIVEGSKNWGKEWLPLIDGYDSGSQESWKSEYNKQISGNNSLTAGTKNLFIRHQFNLTANGNFKGGDTIIVRFRLHSDPFAHGWGWTIDNLNIQNTTFSGLTTGLSTGRIVLWPNPANTILNIQTGEADILKECTVDILDLTGRILVRETRLFLNPGQVIRMDLKNIPEGIFIVNINADNMLKFSGKVVKTVVR